jgi:hypothetical protein
MVLCRPSANNRSYHDWQTARLVVLVAQESGIDALVRFRELLTQHRWLLIETSRRDILIEERVREAGGAFWDAYQTAQRRGYWIEIFPDHFASGKKGIPPIRPPRIGEAFVDQMVQLAGGRRLSKEERNDDKTRNADYRIDDFVIELKDIQEEGMEKPERQAKIATLFRPYFPDEPEILIDPSLLSDEDLQQYAAIVGGPIKNAIKSAAEQIKATKQHLKAPQLRGGIIVVNSGYYSLPPEIFEQLVVEYAQSETRQIESVVCITGGFATDGFNSWINTSFYPPTGGLPVETRMGDAFGSALDGLMNNWSRSGFREAGEPAPIPVAVVFEKDGVTYRYFPHGLPAPWSPDAMA